MWLRELLEACVALLVEYTIWTISAFVAAWNYTRRLLSDNEEPASSRPDADELLVWVRRQLPDQQLDDLGPAWSDGVALLRLLERLTSDSDGPTAATGHRPIQNVNTAFRLSRQHLQLTPTLTVMDVISGREEARLAAYIAAVREAALRQRRQRDCSAPESATAAEGRTAEGGEQAEAAGAGLTAAQAGGTAQFAVRLPQTARLDLLLEMRSEVGDYFSQRLTARSTQRRQLEDTAPVLSTSNSRPPSTIPVGYLVSGRTVSIWYRPPSPGRLTINVFCAGQHVEGSPFEVYVTEQKREVEAVPQAVKTQSNQRRQPVRMLSAVQEIAECDELESYCPLPESQVVKERCDDELFIESDDGQYPTTLQKPNEPSAQKPSVSDATECFQGVQGLEESYNEVDDPILSSANELSLDQADERLSPQTIQPENNTTISKGQKLVDRSACEMSTTNSVPCVIAVQEAPQDLEGEPVMPARSTVPSDSQTPLSQMTSVASSGGNTSQGTPPTETETETEPNQTTAGGGVSCDKQAADDGITTKQKVTESQGQTLQLPPSSTEPTELQEGSAAYHEAGSLRLGWENTAPEKWRPVPDDAQSYRKPETSNRASDEGGEIGAHAYTSNVDSALENNSQQESRAKTDKMDEGSGRIGKAATHPRRKISWQERVVIASSIDDDQYACSVSAQDSMPSTPLSPVTEYTPEPPLYRRNTLDEIVVITGIPNSESKREVEIHQKRKLSRKESKFRSSRSHSSSDDSGSPREPCVTSGDEGHQPPFGEGREVTDDSVGAHAAVNIAEDVKGGSALESTKEQLDISGSQESSEDQTTSLVKTKKSRKISWIEKAEVIPVPIESSTQAMAETKYDRQPKLILQDSIDEPADWIHTPLSESRKELQVLGKVSEEDVELELPEVQVITQDPNEVYVAKEPAPVSSDKDNGTETVEKLGMPSSDPLYRATMNENTDDDVDTFYTEKKEERIPEDAALTMSISSSDTLIPSHFDARPPSQSAATSNNEGSTIMGPALSSLTKAKSMEKLATQDTSSSRLPDNNETTGEKNVRVSTEVRHEKQMSCGDNADLEATSDSTEIKSLNDENKAQQDSSASLAEVVSDEVRAFSGVVNGTDPQAELLSDQPQNSIQRNRGEWGQVREATENEQGGNSFPVAPGDSDTCSKDDKASAKDLLSLGTPGQRGDHASLDVKQRTSPALTRISDTNTTNDVKGYQSRNMSVPASEEQTVVIVGGQCGESAPLTTASDSILSADQPEAPVQDAMDDDISDTDNAALGEGCNNQPQVPAQDSMDADVSEPHNATPGEGYQSRQKCIERESYQAQSESGSMVVTPCAMQQPDDNQGKLNPRSSSASASSSNSTVTKQCNLCDYDSAMEQNLEICPQNSRKSSVSDSSSSENEIVAAMPTEKVLNINSQTDCPSNRQVKTQPMASLCINLPISMLQNETNASFDDNTADTKDGDDREKAESLNKELSRPPCIADSILHIDSTPERVTVPDPHEIETRDVTATPDISYLPQPLIAPEFIFAEECVTSDSEDQEAVEMVLCLDATQEAQPIERPVSHLSNLSIPEVVELGDEKRCQQLDAVQSVAESEQDVFLQEEEMLHAVVTRTCEKTEITHDSRKGESSPYDEGARNTMSSPVCKLQLPSHVREHDAAEHRLTPKDDLGQVRRPHLTPVQSGTVEAREPDDELPSTTKEEIIAESLVTNASGLTNDEKKPDHLIVPNIPAKCKPPRKYSDQYSHFETPRDSQYRLHGMQVRSKVYLGQPRTRCHAQSIPTKSVLPCVILNESEQSPFEANAYRTDPHGTAAVSDEPTEQDTVLSPRDRNPKTQECLRAEAQPSETAAPHDLDRNASGIQPPTDQLKKLHDMACTIDDQDPVTDIGNGPTLSAAISSDKQEGAGNPAMTNKSKTLQLDAVTRSRPSKEPKTVSQIDSSSSSESDDDKHVKTLGQNDDKQGIVGPENQCASEVTLTDYDGSGSISNDGNDANGKQLTEQKAYIRRKEDCLAKGRQSSSSSRSSGSFSSSDEKERCPRNPYAPSDQDIVGREVHRENASTTTATDESSSSADEEDRCRKVKEIDDERAKKEGVHLTSDIMNEKGRSDIPTEHSKDKVTTIDLENKSWVMDLSSCNSSSIAEDSKPTNYTDIYSPEGPLTSPKSVVMLKPETLTASGSFSGAETDKTRKCATQPVRTTDETMSKAKNSLELKSLSLSNSTLTSDEQDDIESCGDGDDRPRKAVEVISPDFACDVEIKPGSITIREDMKPNDAWLSPDQAVLPKSKPPERSPSSEEILEILECPLDTVQLADTLITYRTADISDIEAKLLGDDESREGLRVPDDSENPKNSQTAKDKDALDIEGASRPSSGQHVSKLVHMWDAAIDAGLYPTPTADLSDRIQELHPEFVHLQSGRQPQGVSPEREESPASADIAGTASLCFAEPADVISEENDLTVRAELVTLIEHEGQENKPFEHHQLAVDGALATTLVHNGDEASQFEDTMPTKQNKHLEIIQGNDHPCELNKAKHPDEITDSLPQLPLGPIGGKQSGDEVSADLALVQRSTGDSSMCSSPTTPEFSVDRVCEESLPVQVRQPEPVVWRRASVDRQVGKFNITCVLRPNEAFVPGLKPKETVSLKTRDRRWLNLENYTIMAPPDSPEKASQTPKGAGDVMASKTTVYLSPRKPPNARKELVSLRCVRNSDEENSLTYLPEMKDLTPDDIEEEDNKTWIGKNKSTASEEINRSSKQQQPSASDHQIRLACEKEGQINIKGPRRITPPGNTSLEWRKKILMGNIKDTKTKAASPPMVDGKVGRLRAMFEQIDAAAAGSSDDGGSLRRNRRQFQSMVNVTPTAATTRPSSQDALLKERSRSTVTLSYPNHAAAPEECPVTGSMKERSRSSAALHRLDDHDGGGDTECCDRLQERFHSMGTLNGASEDSGSLPVIEHTRLEDAQPINCDLPASASDNPGNGSGRYAISPTEADFITLGERKLSSQVLNDLDSNGEHQTKLDAIRRYFEGVQEGSIATGDDADMLDEALLAAPGYSRSLPRLDSGSADGSCVSLSSLFAGGRWLELGQQQQHRPVNWSASTPLINSAGAGGVQPGAAPSLLEQVRQLRRRASGGAMSSASLNTSLVSRTAELARRRQDGVVVFGPGMCQGKVNIVNRFQILVSRPEQAPLGVRVYSRREDAGSRAEVCDLNCNYHQVAYWVNQPGWYRLHVLLGGGTPPVDLMTKVSH